MLSGISGHYTPGMNVFLRIWLRSRILQRGHQGLAWFESGKLHPYNNGGCRIAYVVGPCPMFSDVGCKSLAEPIGS